MALGLSSAPGYAMAFFTIPVIAIRTLHVINPTSFMQRFKIADAQHARLIAFVIILINGYDLVGALQDNYAIYSFSIAARLAAGALFAAFGGIWKGTAILEVASAGILGACMYYAKSKNQKF